MNKRIELSLICILTHSNCEVYHTNVKLRPYLTGGISSYEWLISELMYTYEYIIAFKFNNNELFRLAVVLTLALLVRAGCV